jgi:membrane protein YdbS with pleckstrin-like domain
MAEKYPITLQKDEVVVKVLRRHPVRVIMEVAVMIIGLLLLIALFTWLGGLFSFLSGIAMILSGLAGLIVLVIVGLEIYRYRNDIWVITNQRIVDSTKNSPFNHTLSTADLVNVQDINIHRRGVLATLFKFGDVTCQTASQSNLFIFKGVGNPEQVLALVDAHRDLARQR